MTAYTPTLFVRDGVTEVATTWREHWQYIYDGWTLGGPAPATPRSEIVARLSDIDALSDAITALIGQYVQAVDETSGDPLADGRVVIKVSAGTHDIADVVWEA